VAKYSALKDSTLAKLNGSIDRLNSETAKLYECDTVNVIEHLQGQIESLQFQLQNAGNVKAENEILKGETRALHLKGDYSCYRIVLGILVLNWNPIE
jgi:hypothetical protein